MSFGSCSLLGFCIYLFFSWLGSFSCKNSNQRCDKRAKSLQGECVPCLDPCVAASAAGSCRLVGRWVLAPGLWGSPSRFALGFGNCPPWRPYLRALAFSTPPAKGGCAVRISKCVCVFFLEPSPLSWGIQLLSRTSHRDKSTHVSALQVSQNELGEVPVVRLGTGEEQELLLL